MVKSRQMIEKPGADFGLGFRALRGPQKRIWDRNDYRKFSIKGATPYKGAPLFDPKALGFLDVFGHISAKNSPIFIL